MDEAAAGSGRLGDLLHGRYGDFSVLGGTLSVDLALPDLSKHKGLGTLSDVQCTKFFDAQGPRSAASRTEGRRGSRYGDSKPLHEASAAARAAAAMAVLAPGPQQHQPEQQQVQEHCFVCGSLVPGPSPKIDRGRKMYWGKKELDGALRFLCGACHRRSFDCKLVRQTTVVEFCPNGCAGCTPSFA